MEMKSFEQRTADITSSNQTVFRFSKIIALTRRQVSQIDKLNRSFNFQQPIIFERVQAPSVLGKLMSALLRKKEDYQLTFNFYPALICNQIRIAKKVALLPDLEGGNTIIKSIPPALTNHIGTMVNIIADSINNSFKETKDWLSELLQKNFTNDEVFECLNYAFEQLQLQYFASSIILLKGTTNILKVDNAAQI